MTTKQIAGAISLGLCTSLTQAANFGTDLNLTMMPAAGGMAGVGVASSVDVGSAVFGNPATLTALEGTRFMFGATFYQPEVSATHDGSTTGAAWKGDSEAGPYLIPNVAISQSLSPDTVLGLGLTVVSGVGSDFRGVAGSLNPLAEIMVFGANAGVAHKLSEQWSLGAQATIGMGLGQAGLNNNTASTSNFGFRATLGTTYSSGDILLGAYYRSPLAIEYENMVQYADSDFHSPTFEQPQEFAVGFAHSGLVNGHLMLAADLILKDWESADAYKDLYENQTIIQLGAQYATGDLKWRLGFIHTDSPIKADVRSQVGDIDSLLIGSATVPMNPVLTQYVQATNAEVIWEDQLTLGAGWAITPKLTLDGHVNVALEREETIGATKVEAGAWQMGAALTWRFDP